MRSHPHDDYDQAAAADRMLYREESRLTSGASAYHQLDPSEIAMRLEEQDPATIAAQERASLRNEIFSGAAEYLFADGPDPAEVRLRIEGFFRSFHPDLCDQIRGPLTWCQPDAVAAVLRKYHLKLAAVAADARSRGSLSTWSRELERETDSETVAQTLAGLIEFIASEGRTWRHLVAVAYCVAKALRPSLIAGMSLHDIAILSGDEGGRATPCDRIKRLYNRRLAAAGAKGSQVHFQKSSGVSATYATAQLGNHNRRRSARQSPKHDPRKL
jgi:hypothetical protein